MKKPKPKRKGHPISAETRAKIAATKKGQRNPQHGKKGRLAAFYGRKHTAEIKRKMSQFRTGKKQSAETRDKRSRTLQGHSISQETRDKISESVRRHYAMRRHGMLLARNKFGTAVLKYERGTENRMPVVTRTIGYAPHEKIAEIVAGLPRIEREIIERRFGFRGKAQNLSEIAVELDLSPKQIIAYQNRAFARIRKAVEDLPLP